MKIKMKSSTCANGMGGVVPKSRKTYVAHAYNAASMARLAYNAYKSVNPLNFLAVAASKLALSQLGKVGGFLGDVQSM